MPETFCRAAVVVEAITSPTKQSPPNCGLKSMIAGRFVHRKRPIAVPALNRANHSAGRCSDARAGECSRPPKGGIGVFFLLQFFSGTPSPAIGVGMVQFDQFLVTRFHVCPGRGPGKFKDIKGRALGGGPLLAAIELGLRPLAEARIVSKVERVMDVDVWAVAAAGAERPDRAAPGRVGADMRLDLLGAEAGEVVPLLVVLAHVLQTEPTVLVQPVAGARGAGLAGEPAAWGFADALVRRCAVGGRQGFRSPSRHSDNMCSTVWRGKRGE